MGRHLGIYDPPRRVLSAIEGAETVEMRHSQGRRHLLRGRHLVQLRPLRQADSSGSAPRGAGNGRGRARGRLPQVPDPLYRAP